ncbi:MAG TPA: hypothetical protein VGK26_10825 [Thermoanaerobaculia bacterium]|jgi:hypothetical protein
MVTISMPHSRKACLAFILFLAASALSAGHRGVSVSIDDGRDPSRCEDLSIRIDDHRPERAQETIRVSETPGRVLKVRVPDHSGVRVVGTDRSDVEVTACKAAVSSGDLPRISIVQRADEISVDGPAGDSWVAYLLIAAPRGASLDLDAESAPIGLRGLSGHVTARTVNGPISLSDCPGEIDAEADNGPIHVSGSGGSLRLRTSNGPIGVRLSGTSWSGAGLDASAVNGPVDLVIPAGYRSGAVVESLGHAPVRCVGSACADARRTWDENGDGHKRIELGAGPALVRLTTRNGPVSVRSGSGGASDEADEDDESE